MNTDGGVVYGDIKLSVGSHLVSRLGCNWQEVYTSTGDRHKYAIVFHTRFMITNACQSRN